MKIAIVTGGTRGIGAAISKQLQEDGFLVYCTGTGPQEELSKNDTGTQKFISVNFSNDTSVKDFENFLKGLDHIDALVNNAGINIIKPLNEVTNEDYAKIQKINLEACYRTARVVTEVMKASGQGGRIINIASIWSVVTKAHRSLYSTMKSGLLGMTRAMAVEFAPDNILINAVSPGFVLTDLTRESLGEDGIVEMQKKVPIDRMAEPYEIANVVSFLCDDKSSYLTGQNLVVDGGFSIV